MRPLTARLSVACGGLFVFLQHRYDLAWPTIEQQCGDGTRDVLWRNERPDLVLFPRGQRGPLVVGAFKANLPRHDSSDAHVVTRREAGSESAQARLRRPVLRRSVAAVAFPSAGTDVHDDAIASGEFAPK